MHATRMLVAVALSLLLAVAAAAQNPCGDCRKAAGDKYQACQNDAKGAAPATQVCAKSMSDSMQACQERACAKDVAKMYEGYCTGCLQQADTPAKKKACEESVCRKAAGK